MMQYVSFGKVSNSKYVTVFWKTDHLHTRTEIHLLPIHDRHTSAKYSQVFVHVHIKHEP